MDSVSQPYDALPQRSTRTHIAMFFLMVVFAAVALYRPSLRAEFLILDDPQYTTSNPYVLYPSWSKLVAFFTEVLKPSVVAGYYQPLTMASLMLDRVIEAHLAGAYTPRIDPTLFHLTNILLHGLCAGLVFILILRLMGSRWIALACALLFAVHPLNVEVVAWVSQRKALLSTLFALLMLLAYLRHAATRRPVWLFLTALAFTLSMLSKPTGLFLPLVLLLLDVWPLRRWSLLSLKEKLPLFVLAILGGWIAYASQTTAVDLSEAGRHRGFLLTLLIACHNFAFYLCKIVLPIRLCPHYIMPLENEITPLAWPFAAGLLFTLAAIVACIRAYRRRDHAVWTMLAALLLLLGPTLGPVRFMGTIAADRFSYLPMIAVLILVADLVRRQKAPRRLLLAPIGALVIPAFTLVAWRQQAVWQNSVTFYSAITDRFPDAPAGHYGLGNAYLSKYEGSFAAGVNIDDVQRSTWLDEASQAYQKTLSLDPAFSHAYYRVGHILITRGHPTEGIKIIKKGLRQPNADPEGYFFLGLAYTHIGAYAESIPPYEECLKHRPSWIEVRLNLANALLRTGRAAEAIPHYQRLYELNPTDLDGLQNWAVALLTIGDAPSAVEKLRGVVEIRSSLVAQLAEPKPSTQAASLADARYTLAGALALIGDAAGAIENLRLALEVKPELLKQAERNRAFAPLKNTAEWKNLRDSFPPR